MADPITPSVRFRDLPAAIEFYTGPLGFKLERGTVEEGNIAVSRDHSRLMLESAGTFSGADYNRAITERLGVPGAVSLYIETADLADLARLHANAVDAGLKVIDPLADRPWGQAEFTVEDSEGHWLSFYKALG